MLSSSSYMSDSDVTDHQYSDESGSASEEGEMSGAEAEVERGGGSPPEEKATKPDGGKDGTAEKKRSKRTPGVVYLSRIPPYMKPHKLKHLLSPYGTVGNIFLQPEEDSVRKRRVKFGGNKKRNFTEGWVEFADRRVAKAVSMALNNVPIGGRKRNYYHDDIWNIKYLPKFRWTHLAEKKAYERAVKDQQMRTEMSQAKRENKHYLTSVDKKKEIDAIVKRKRRHREIAEGEGEEGEEEEEVTSRYKRRYMQRRVTRSSSPEEESGEEEQRHTRPSRPKTRLKDTLLRKIQLHCVCVCAFITTGDRM